MSTSAKHSLHEVSSIRCQLGALAPYSYMGWSGRLRADEQRAHAHLSQDLAEAVDGVERRSREVGAESLVLTGSTARGRRTSVSDLDFHVIGPEKPESFDLSFDVDVICDTGPEFMAKIDRGDDFAHWTLRLGCVLFDSGVLRDAANHVAAAGLWPDPERKLRQARRALIFAEKMVASEDYMASLEQVRGALTLAARWWLLAHDVFPLARDELSEQLIETDQYSFAHALRSSIHDRPEFEALTESIHMARALTG